MGAVKIRVTDERQQIGRDVARLDSCRDGVRAAAGGRPESLKF